MSKDIHIMVVFGTRPEALKLMPVIRALKKSHKFKTTVCVTAQHRSMLDQVLDLYQITPDIDLDLMLNAQRLTNFLGNAMKQLGEIFHKEKPNWILVQGDTATTLAASLAAFYEKIPIAHIEAGLRTYNYEHPWPEEMQRQIVGKLSSIHYAPTQIAKNNLLNEDVPENQILVTGNTVIDTLLETVDLLHKDDALTKRLYENFDYLSGQKLLLVTGHRRENLDGGLVLVCRALKALAMDYQFEIIFPVHLNPNVKTTVHEILGGIDNIHLIEPLDYLSFVYLMDRSWVIITDSGGVQEEAPSLNKPVLVVRETTERPEVISAGAAQLVGTNPENIIKAVVLLKNDPDFYMSMANAENPFGDGHASDRIVESLYNYKNN